MSWSGRRVALNLLGRSCVEAEVVTASVVDTFVLTVLSGGGRGDVQLSIAGVSVGDLVLEAVVQIVLISFLTDHARPLRLTTVVNTGMGTLMEERLSPFTLSHASLHLSHKVEVFSKFPYCTH